MYWYRRPPYLRWAAATVVVLIAFIIELSPEPTELYPFTTSSVAHGDRISPSLLEWREVPAGLLPPYESTDGFATRPISKGEPIMVSMVTAQSPLPSDWWSVPVPLDPSVGVGTDVLVIITDPPLTVAGVVVAAGRDDGFGMSPVGAVAVSRESVENVARAARYDDVVVVTRSR